MNTLHIHSQQQWHDDAWIIGSRVALQALRDAIDVALQEGRSLCESFVNDGEGFSTFIICEESLDDAAVPYTGEVAIEKCDEAIRPYQR